jgi:Fe-Mn family superoxide dismutase
MNYSLPELLRVKNPVAQRMSHATFEYHCGMHHMAYVINMGKLNKGTPFERVSLESIIRNAPAGEIYNAAAQVWIHTFFWRSMEPNGGGEPGGALADAINRRWSSLDKFREAFQTAAVSNVSSGWTWLVKRNNGAVDIDNMGAAGTLLTSEGRPLLCLDVREHAYYPEYRNMRLKFAKDFLNNLVNWNFAEKNFNLEEAPDNPAEDKPNEEIY